MSRSKKQIIIENVTISGVAAEGKAIARLDSGIVAFVPMAVPGDVVDIKVIRKKKKFLEAIVTKFHSYSDLRVDPFCEHFGVCGGCKWQHLDYTDQLKFKQQEVTDNLTRLGHLDLPQIEPIIPSQKTTEYRNKLEYTFSDKRWLTAAEIREDDEPVCMDALGFHVPKYFDKVVDIKKCWLQDDVTNRIRNAVRDFALENEFSFYNFRSHRGCLRNLIIRNTSTGELMVIVVFSDAKKEKIAAMLSFIEKTFPEITSLQYIINRKMNDSITDQEVIHYSGNPYIEESMEGLTFRVGPKSFYQTNSLQAYELYKVARSFAELSGNEVVYDLYTGTGTIANFIARGCKKVVGIEYVEEAVADARINAELNSIGNSVFVAGDMKDVLSESFFDQHGLPEVIILDPPRAGVHPDVITAILGANPSRIVYVSCNPATQARDVALLAGNYKVTRVQPVDMFPHTHHVENVVQLSRIV